MARDKVYELIEKVNKESRKAKNHKDLVNNLYNFGEQLMDDAFKNMPLDKLLRMNIKINRYIQQKKEFIRVANAQAGNDNELKKIQDENKKKKIR